MAFPQPQVELPLYMNILKGYESSQIRKKTHVLKLL